LPVGKSRFASGQEIDIQLFRNTGRARQPPGNRVLSCKLRALHACGEDDGTANRTPSAWMIMRVLLHAGKILFQIVFSVWVTLSEHKWVILGERRGARKRGFRAMQFNFVVSTNDRAVRLWQCFNFDICWTASSAFLHPVHGFVDAYVMCRKL
jgi:hypothetical protein